MIHDPKAWACVHAHVKAAQAAVDRAWEEYRHAERMVAASQDEGTNIYWLYWSVERQVIQAREYRKACSALDIAESYAIRYSGWRMDRRYMWQLAIAEDRAHE